jgi:hypothetical protein
MGKAAAAPAAPAGINARVLTGRIDEFLGSRGYRAEEVRSPSAFASATADKSPPGGFGEPRMYGDEQVRLKPDTTSVKQETPLEFVCEEDVRQAIQAGRKLLISEARSSPRPHAIWPKARVITFPIVNFLKVRV